MIECGFIERNLRLTFLSPMHCAVCNKNDYSGRGKLWDKGAGQYEYICIECECEILKEGAEE